MKRQRVVLTLPIELTKELVDVSQSTRISQERLMERALTVYLASYFRPTTPPPLPTEEPQQ